MLDFLKIFGLTILGIIAFGVIALFGIWLLFWIWPIIIIALPIALIIYIFNLYQNHKRELKGLNNNRRTKG